ncbi:MAG: nucleotidyl transferase AbiEii/AbiGii toxin family protein [Bacteroidota bacterium]|nr:nucleotidyl transferase AbiEii/AbiGii toxin family protein [Bacteroidota bacterium]
MLSYETVDTPTLELLKRLMLVPAFSHTRLVGGTSLALQYGHRKSVDLDLFGTITLESFEIANELKKLGQVQVIKQSANIHIFIVNGIKVDFVNYSYPWIDDLLLTDGIRFAKPKDICAMKLSAICGRGSKKDFFDIYFLSKHYSFKDMLEFYEKKYADGSIFLVMKSIGYFEDAEQDYDPEMLIPISWERVKEHILLLSKAF